MLALRYEHRQSFEQISQSAGGTPQATQRALSRTRLALHDCIRATLDRSTQAP